MTQGAKSVMLRAKIAKTVISITFRTLLEVATEPDLPGDTVMCSGIARQHRPGGGPLVEATAAHQHYSANTVDLLFNRFHQQMVGAALLAAQTRHLCLRRSKPVIATEYQFWDRSHREFAAIQVT